MNEPFETEAHAARPQPQGLADVLDRVLDKGIVIAGDISISVLDIELLTIRIRLLIASVDKAQEMGINWWQHDTNLTTKTETHLEGKSEGKTATVKETSEQAIKAKPAAVREEQWHSSETERERPQGNQAEKSKTEHKKEVRPGKKTASKTKTETRSAPRAKTTQPGKAASSKTATRKDVPGGS